MAAAGQAFAGSLEDCIKASTIAIVNMGDAAGNLDARMRRIAVENRFQRPAGELSKGVTGRKRIKW
jgi:hypothetical protein